MALTAGVIGCGNISRYHFAGLEKAGAVVKWVCDLSEERAAPWVARYGATYTADYRQVVEDASVDVVNVTPISSVHKPICLGAIDAGKAVICEKTLAENADDALDIVRRAEEKGTIFYTSYMKRFTPAVEQAKALLPRLGRIVTSHFRVHQPWGNLWAGNPPDGHAHTPPGGTSAVIKNYGGGILVCGGSHILDLVNYFVGRPSRLFATFHVPEDRDYDLHASALMESENGIVHFDALAHGLGHIGFLRDGWDERVEITGVDGRLDVFSAKWDQMDCKASMFVHYDNKTGEATEYRYPPVSSFERAVVFFCANIEKGEQGSQSRLTGYVVDELIGTIKRSAAEGRALDIDWRI